MAARPPPNRSRLPIYLGLGVLAAGGYYLYAAGGDPKVAEKKFEHDAARASSAIKSELPGKGKEYKKGAEEWGDKAKSQFDSTASEISSKLDSSRKEAGRELQKKIDEADRKVEEGAAKAKSGVSSWFGK